MKYLRIPCNLLLAGLLCLTLRTFALADVVNTAYANYNDSTGGGTLYTSTSTTVKIGILPEVSTDTVSGVVGTALTYQIKATNSPTSYNATNLPNGLTVNTTTGKISGTPTAAGTTNATISATNAAGTNTATLTITITAITPPSITLIKSDGGVTTAKKNDPLTFTITYSNAAGAGAATNFAITDAVPAGTTLGTINNGGVLSGSTIKWTIGNVPANTSGSVSFTVTVN